VHAIATLADATGACATIIRPRTDSIAVPAQGRKAKTKDRARGALAFPPGEVRSGGEREGAKAAKEGRNAEQPERPEETRDEPWN
jgi:hypothetical protein